MDTATQNEMWGSGGFVPSRSDTTGVAKYYENGAVVPIASEAPHAQNDVFPVLVLTGAGAAAGVPADVALSGASALHETWGEPHPVTGIAKGQNIQPQGEATEARTQSLPDAPGKTQGRSGPTPT